MDELREFFENKNIIIFRNLLDEENKFENFFGIFIYVFWIVFVYVMIFIVILKVFEEKKMKMFGKNEVCYLCVVVFCIVFKWERVIFMLFIRVIKICYLL